MKNPAKLITTALVMALALTLPACGDSSTSGDKNASNGNASSTTAANITFRTDPAGAQVWIDGKNAGTSPVVIAVDAGSHALEFKREGFEPVKDSLDIQAGKDLTVTAALAVTGEPEARVKTLLAALGIPAHEDLEAKAHRAPMKNGIMLYWPQKKVRKSGLSTWRIEVTPDYADDGYLVFKKGKTELHRAPFHVTGKVNEGALPEAVIEALKRGSRITWGIDFPEKNKKDVMGSFVVDDGKALQRKLEKLQKRSVYRRAGDLEREMAKIALKRNYRYYTEALTDSMSVLNTWPDTMLADKVIADSLQRLKLKESMLYNEILKRLRGGGKFSPTKPGAGSSGMGDVSRRLPESLVAPKVRKTDDAKKADGGMKAGGVGVTPTGGDQKRQPGPIVPGKAADDGVKAGSSGAEDEQRRREQVRQMQDELKALEAAAAEVSEAEARMKDSSTALETAVSNDGKAKAALEAAQKELADAEASGDATRVADAQKALNKATDDANTTAKEVQAAKERLEQDRIASERVIQEHGTSNDMSGKVEQLKNAIEEAKQPQPHEDGHAPDGGIRPDRVAEDPLAPESERDHGMEEEAVLRGRLEEQVKNAEEQIQNVQQWQVNSQQAQDAAQKAYGAAEKELDEAEQSGDATRIAAAEAAFTKAHEDLSRATMELERANGSITTAEQELETAKADLSKWDAEKPDREAAKQDPASRNP